MARKPGQPPPILMIFGADEFEKSAVLREALDALLPPGADRAMALCEYDGTKSEEDGGPAAATIFDELNTLPFLAERRVVVVRDADAFISAAREALERYVAKPSASGTLILVCRTFQKTARLYKALDPLGGVRLCEPLKGAQVASFIQAAMRDAGKQIEPQAAARLAALIGPERGTLAREVEKLALYAADRPVVTADDVAELVGQTRTEKIFGAMDAAGLGRAPLALRLWRQALAGDPDAPFMAVGGVAFCLRKWLSAHRMREEGASFTALGYKLFMPERDIAALLGRMSPARILHAISELAELDSQAKTGRASIESALELFLLRLAAA